MKERLQKIIARSGLGSRRCAEDYIRQGRVAVNGLVVTRLGTLADPAADSISVDGAELTPAENRVYLMLHKPPGYVTSLHDPEGRKTINLLYSDISERLYPVGRLDYDTEGLLVITNDGAFSQLIQHPRHGLEKKYLVKVKGVPAEAALRRLRDGVMIDGRKISRSGVRLIKKGVKSSWCEVVLHEGLNRQLKKMFDFIGHPSVRIIRTAIGPLQLDRLPSGTYRFLTRAEIEAVREHGVDRVLSPVPRVHEKRRPVSTMRAAGAARARRRASPSPAPRPSSGRRPKKSR